MKTLEISEKTGFVAGALILEPKNEIRLRTTLGHRYSLTADEIPVSGRLTQGQCLVELIGSDQVVDVWRTDEWRYTMTPPAPVIDPDPSLVSDQASELPEKPVEPDFDTIEEEAETTGLELVDLSELQVSATDLVAALRQLRSGGELRLGQGVIRLPKGLVIRKALRIRGEGAAQTKIVCQSQQYEVAAIQFTGVGPWTVTGLSVGFDHPAASLPEEHENCAMQIDGGCIEISHCRFHGAANAGLQIVGNTRGQVTRCTADENEFGILVYGDSSVVLEKNQIRNNARDGILLSGETSCVVRKNECVHNGGDGISSTLKARPTVDSNRCLGNGSSGIGFVHDTGGVALRNECCENKDDGIRVAGRARPRLEENFCLKNGRSGIGYHQRSGGIALKNQCRESGSSGITVVDEANPTLEDNLCQKGGCSGISFGTESKGSASRNECRENALHGIQVGLQAQATLTGNRCQKNRGSGIFFDQSAQGVVQENQCRENAQSGIHAQGTSTPCLVKNHCTHNGRHGISHRGRSSGTVQQNTCEKNAVRSLWTGHQAKPERRENLCKDPLFPVDAPATTRIQCHLMENGIAHGYLRQDDVLDALSHLSVSPEHLHEILASFRNSGIRVVDDDDPAATGLTNAFDLLVVRGRAKNMLTYDEISDVLAPFDVPPDQFDEILERIVHEGIEVVDDDDEEEEVAKSGSEERIELLQADTSVTEFLAALRALRSGGELHLGKTTLRLPEGLAIHKAIRLRGEGPEHTRIVCESRDDCAAVLHFSGPGPWSLEDLSVGFEIPGEAPSEDHTNWAVYAEAGPFEVTRCRIYGARGHGLSILTNEGRVSHCDIEENFVGIGVLDESRVLLESNRIQRNQYSGITIYEKATCTVRDNDCVNNAGSGIVVGDEARPTLENNRCQGNKFEGICFDDQSGGLAAGNECTDNGTSGICAGGALEHTLLDNRCLRNGCHGISFSENATGVARGNLCVENEYKGIYLPDGSAVTLDKNQCQSNGLDVLTPGDASIRKAYDPDTYERFVAIMGTLFSPKWAAAFLDLVQEMLLQFEIKSEDPRLSLSLPKGGGLNVTIGQRYVLTPWSDRCVAIIVPLGLQAEKFGGERRYSFSRGKHADADCVSVPLLAREGLHHEIKKIWLESVAEEMRRSNRSGYKKYHQPIFYDAALKREVRQAVLYDAFS